MHDTVIYLGPTLGRAEASRILEADYLPPISRGDLGRLPEHVKVIGIVDGEFFQTLAVSPKEIIRTLDRGVRVFGASSMGALRASETDRYGTVGVGRIFTMFRDGVVDEDDEVALVYEAETFHPLSVPLVNIRNILEIAFSQDLIDREEMRHVLRRMKALYFPDRTYAQLKHFCPALAELLGRETIPDLKREDAIEMLQAIKMQRVIRDPNEVQPNRQGWIESH
jgi:TfuA protein